ncbi:amidohydrolase [Arthrobacter celericrescens]|uniref:amidohydrolase n=1 Tax=Arthrobacter celericrescens TaxID=2320851 RepID=UPI000EA2AB91|nr:amidohydrolase [Arthrobacter celericrescens]
MDLDLVLHNADIITMDPARPSAHSLGVLHGRVVGLDGDIAGLGARHAVDLGGRTLVPGFIDAHCHTPWFGLGLLEPSVDGCTTPAEVLAVLAAAAPAAAAGDDGWLISSGFNHDRFGGQFPSLAELDAATSAVPLFLRHNSGHQALVNTAALKTVGRFEPGSPDPVGGRIVRDWQGLPTGVVEETAQEVFQQAFQPRPLSRLQRAVEEATGIYASQGITSFTDAGIGAGWIGQSPVELAAFQRAAAAGTLKARAQLMPVLDALKPVHGHATDGLGTGLDLGIHSGFGSELLSLGPVKVFLDGSLLSRTAAVTEPYCHHPHGSHGYFQEDPAQLRERIEAAYRSGWAVAAHAIGDRAIDLALDLFEELQSRYGRNALPNRIEHASVVRPDQLPRLAEAGIAVTPQSSFFAEGGDNMAASLGEERSAWAYRAASFLDSGTMVAGSSDRPVADGDVLRGMQAYVDRRTGSGRVFGNPDERLSRHQALGLYTTSAAAATGAAASKGALSPGKLADAVVLSGSPLEASDLTDLTVEATLLGGAPSYSRIKELQS